MATVKFHTSCAKHRGMFITTCIEEGLSDPAMMERVRLRFIAECGRLLFGEHLLRYLREVCIGCEKESWSLELVHQIAAEERTWLHAHGGDIDLG